MFQESRFTIVHANELEKSGPKWSLVRRSLGVESFGLNLVEIPPGEGIPEHDERERDQEEVFYVISGKPTFEIDGERYPVPAGTFVRLDPEPTRRFVNEGDEPARVLVISAPRSSGYEPMGWA